MQVEKNARQSWLHPQVRMRKARKILAVLDDFLEGDLQSSKCLDVGCSQGVIARVLAARFALVVGVDVDREALRGAAKASTDGDAIFMAASGMALPFEGETFDVVICAQVYEHVTDAATLFSEIHRVLKKPGVCFFSGPNKLAPIEAHYSLPFIHWFPRPLADACLRMSGKGDSYWEKPFSLWKLRRLLKDFEIVDYTARMIKAPAYYCCEEEVKPTWLSRIPWGVLTRMVSVFPNFNWILRKGRSQGG